MVARRRLVRYNQIQLQKRPEFRLNHLRSQTSKDHRVNFNPVPTRNTSDVEQLVSEEMTKIRYAEIAKGLSAFLVTPRLETRLWEWQAPHKEYPVWMVAESQKYDYGIAFSDYGFAPDNPWGLVFLSHKGFDADYCWYPTLESAYEDSRLIEEYREAASLAPYSDRMETL